MPIRTRTIHELIARRDEADDHDDFAFGGLHFLVAGLYLASGAEAALGERRGDYRLPGGTRWGPLAAAPLAAAAHAGRALAPCRATRVLAQIMNGVAVAVGAAGLASSVASALGDTDDDSFFGRRRRSLRERIPSLAPLAFGMAGVIGAMIDHQEEEAATTQARLERRARVVERLVPGRKPRLDRIVVHI